MFLFHRHRTAVGLRAYADAFQPFVDSIFSLTAIFFAIVNLPSSIRHDEDASMLVCVLSGPNEVAADHMHNITFYFKEELMQLYHGISMAVFVPATGLIEQRVVRVRLCLALHLTIDACITQLLPSFCALQFSSHQALLVQGLFDLPAAQKFLALPAFSNKTNSCSKCKFALHDGDCWSRVYEPRTRQEHFHHGQEWLKKTTKTDADEYVSAFGYRYTPLLALPYFDSIRMNMFDMMVRARIVVGLLSQSSLTRDCSVPTTTPTRAQHSHDLGQCRNLLKLLSGAKQPKSSSAAAKPRAPTARSTGARGGDSEPDDNSDSSSEPDDDATTTRRVHQTKRRRRSGNSDADDDVEVDNDEEVDDGDGGDADSFGSDTPPPAASSSPSSSSSSTAATRPRVRRRSSAAAAASATTAATATSAAAAADAAHAANIFAGHVLTKGKFKLMQERMNRLRLPRTLGRLPKIIHLMSGFKAAEYRYAHRLFQSSYFSFARARSCDSFSVSRRHPFSY